MSGPLAWRCTHMSVLSGLTGSKTSSQTGVWNKVVTRARRRVAGCSEPSAWVIVYSRSSAHILREKEG
eukprot:3312801-Rhodomonas_salina.2